MIDAPASMHRNDSAAISSVDFGTFGLTSRVVDPLIATSMITGCGMPRSLPAARRDDDPYRCASSRWRHRSDSNGGERPVDTPRQRTRQTSRWDAQREVPALVSANPPRFRNRSENEFAGCRAALDSLHQQDPGTLSIGLILHRHRLLFSFVGGGGGRFKLDDNLVTNRHDDGTTTTRFAPVSAAETEYYVTELVDRTNDALAAGVVHPVLITAAFRFDLLCIHPFADGNGRVARLMTST